MKPIAVLDTEVYINYWLCKFLNPATGRTMDFELCNGTSLDIPMLRNILEKYTLVSFNGINYDLPMISYALSGATNEDLKVASDRIILGNLRSWQFEQEFGIETPKNLDHIDLIEVLPGVMDSLKIYGGRVHTKKMQDLPIEPSAIILPEQRALLREYCGNDLRVTNELFDKLRTQLDLRVKMSAEYGMDLRSKSDAQIAETVICSEIQKILDGPVTHRKILAGTKFKYRAPAFISFQSEKLNRVFQMILDSEFVVMPNGTISGLNAELEKEPIEIRGRKYQIGIGGLHSCESNVCYKSDFDTIIVAPDVRSYYPQIILNAKLYPKHLGESFLEVFGNIVTARLQAKDSGNDESAESLKICINGTFGKTNSKFSKLYAPDMMLQVTITGQLASLMLIEDLEMANIPVISANTDGIVIACPRHRQDEMLGIISAWEKLTNFTTESEHYLAVYSRDVNNYVALKYNGKVKRKGIFAPPDLKHSPVNEICADAVIAYLKADVPVEETIRLSQDIRKFVTVRKVNGGAEKDGGYVGKAIRFYHSLATKTGIHYCLSGNLVPDSSGAMPLMELPDEFPTDVNHKWYIGQANEMLAGIGIMPSQLQANLYFDETLLELQ